jgi:plastocyanin
LEFDTKRLETSEDGTTEFDEPGSYPYFCRFHPFMTGTVEVVE